MTSHHATNTLPLGTEKISKLLLRYAIPSIIAMTASSLYNMVDSIFIGHGVGAMAISGLAITMPLMALAAAFGAMVGIGAASLMSIKLGQNDKKSAMMILGNQLLLNVVIGIGFTVIGLLFLDQILYSFGASDVTIVYARDYMRIILLGNIFTHIYLGLNNSLRASGYPQKSMIIMIVAVVSNSILDALFIFGFGWGIEGAAWATVIAQALAMMLEFKHFLNRKNYIHITPDILRFKAKIVKGILAIGMAPFLMNVCSSVVVIFINNALYAHGGDIYVGAYGIVNRVAFMFIMIVIGLNQGMQPIVGYNYGAGKTDRVLKTLKMGVIAGTCITSLGFFLGVFIPRQVAMMFTTDATLLEISEQGMRIVMTIFPLVGFQMVTSNFFQSIGMAKKAIFLSLTRQLIFLVPLLAILPGIYGTAGVWVSMPIADSFSTILATVLIVRQIRIFRAQKPIQIV